jgi:trans-AT polyketide synthase/acyltransferase/oxidoreductase domain-containing protein
MSLGSKVLEEQSSVGLPVLCCWERGDEPPAFSPAALKTATARFREPIAVVRESEHGRVGVGFGGQLGSTADANDRSRFRCLGLLPALYPEWLGDRAFTEVHHLRFPYVTGAMARGIGSTAIVIAMGRAGMLGFFGAAGLSPDQVEASLVEISSALGPEKSWGSNLIHSPNQSGLEDAVVDRLLKHDVRRVSASAYMALTPSVVRYAYSGVRAGPGDRISRRHVLAKISRPEVARRFMSPPPAEMLHHLVETGQLTAAEAKLAARLPVAEDVTVEADSGGHTDNQPLTALLPTILRLRDELSREFSYTRPIRVGASGGLGTPSAVAAAFSLGAAYVLTGSINQACVESGVSEEAKRMLAEARIGDVGMSPSADMFELGVKVQVLKRGTMFAARAGQLYELYRRYPALESLPAEVVARLEKQVFRKPLAQIWEETERFFAARDPRENERAARDPKHKMALVFRWYLGHSSYWPIQGDSSRRVDYQLWCGPAMGAFNNWVGGSFLEMPENRRVVQVALNLLEGAAQLTRAQQLRNYGAPVPAAAFDCCPRPLA